MLSDHAKPTGYQHRVHNQELSIMLCIYMLAQLLSCLSVVLYIHIIYELPIYCFIYAHYSRVIYHTCTLLRSCLSTVLCISSGAFYHLHHVCLRELFILCALLLGSLPFVALQKVRSSLSYLQWGQDSSLCRASRESGSCLFPAVCLKVSHLLHYVL